MRKLVLLAALLPAACVENPPPSAGPSVPDTAGMIQAWGDLDLRCRGGSGNDPATHRACAARDALYPRIESAGWCYGENATYGYEMKWEVCNRKR